MYFDPFANMAFVKPFLKWAGGKSQLLQEIRAKYPEQLGVSITKYAEPFVGGGAVLFDILCRYSLDEVYISDINRELVLTYSAIRDDVNSLVGILKELEKNYLLANEQRRKYMYYQHREHFNGLKLIRNKDTELAALFIFLNKTCFNGLYRVNAQSVFNVPQGRYKNPTICDESNLRAVSKKLQNVTIVCGDYKQSCDFIDQNTFAYFDPPYRPLTVTASFNAYTQNGFSDKEQSELAHFIDELSAKGAYVVASNSDPKNSDEGDDFFDNLYARHKVNRINANRMINSHGNKRGKINELLICNA